MPTSKARCQSPVRVGLAGWSVAAGRHGKLLPAVEVGASGWQRDVAAFDFVEINSSFYRQVRPSTCEKWAGEVAPDFLFAVKMHRLTTHDTRLKNTALLENFFHMVAGLGRKLAVVLVQLPPTLTFDHAVAETFFAALKKPLVAARFASRGMRHGANPRRQNCWRSTASAPCSRRLPPRVKILCAGRRRKSRFTCLCTGHRANTTAPTAAGISPVWPHFSPPMPRRAGRSSFPAAVADSMTQTLR